jgi:hypothetical protein
MGLLYIEDPETGLNIAAPTSSASFLNAWHGWHKDRADHWQKLCRRCGAACLELSSEDDAATALTRFFAGRSGQ